jgi:outer membrane receptor for ferrienterochelin and colicins
MLLALWIPWAANAATTEDADAALQALLGALDQETKIATHTKMNIDFVPGMVSVLYGKDLQDRGVRTASEALSLIPGVELSLSSDGQTQVFVRGIGTTFSSGKIKVLLNGVPFNSTLSVATTSLHIPVEQIDRIEVIRGPGSTIYGEFAYSGVVNVVTRKQENNAFVRYGDLGSKTVGLQLWKENAAQNLRVNLNFSGTNIEGDAVESGPDILRAPMFAAITRAPGPTNEKEHDRNAVFQLDYNDFNFMVQWSKVGSGDAFGLAYALPDPEPRIMREVDMLSVQAEQHWALTSDLNVRAHMGWLDYSLKSGLHQLYPPGFAGINPMTGQPFYPDGLIGSPNYAERKYRAGAEFNFNGMKDHEWLFGFEWLYTDSGNTYAIRNYNPNVFIPTTNIPVPVPLAVYRGDQNWLEEGLTHQI